MKAVVYYISIVFIYLVVLLPFPLFYLFSDFVFVLLFHVIGYRRKVVSQNLRNAFPEKSEQEIQLIAKRFYGFLCDLFLETFKTLVISKKEALKRCHFTPEAQAILDGYNQRRQSIILVMGHFGNWEWGGNAFSLASKQQLYVIYHPLENKYFNDLIVHIRTRFGTKLVAMKDTFKDMVNYRDQVTATAFIADQTPQPDTAYWMTFLNQDTPVFKGTEKIAKKLNYPVVYLGISRKKRGYYEISVETLFENSKDTKEGEITEAHTRRLEDDIRRQPEIWLWSHRRWKHKKPGQITN